MGQSHFQQPFLVLRASPGHRFHVPFMPGSSPDCRSCLRHSTWPPGCKFTLQLPTPSAEKPLSFPLTWECSEQQRAGKRLDLQTSTIA